MFATQGPRRMPKRIFTWIEAPLAVPQPGELVVRTCWLSLDPYLSLEMVGSARNGMGRAVRGRIIGKVVQSEDPAFPIGSLVLGTGGWQNWNLLTATECELLAADERWSATAHFGVLGASGLTAWVGMSLAGPQRGDTVLISAASGPVGSVCGQIAAAWGCRVLGTAGGEQKCAAAKARYGYAECLDHRQPGLDRRIADLSGRDIGLLYENVGAPSMDAVLPSMCERGTIILCGLAAHYGSDAPISFANFRDFMRRHLTMRSFHWKAHEALLASGRAFLRDRLADGKLGFDETVTQGLSQAPAAYLRMLSGDGLGKHILSVAPTA